MLECKDGTTDEWLAKLVAEVAGTVGGFYQYLLWCLVEPLAHGEDVFPVAGCSLAVTVFETVFLKARISCHIYGGAGNRP